MRTIGIVCEPSSTGHSARRSVRDSWSATATRTPGAAARSRPIPIAWAVTVKFSQSRPRSSHSDRPTALGGGRISSSTRPEAA
jgi:hypothetical protein